MWSVQSCLFTKNQTLAYKVCNNCRVRCWVLYIRCMCEWQLCSVKVAEKSQRLSWLSSDKKKKIHFIHFRKRTLFVTLQISCWYENTMSRIHSTLYVVVPSLSSLPLYLHDGVSFDRISQTDRQEWIFFECLSRSCHLLERKGRRTKKLCSTRTLIKVWHQKWVVSCRGEWTPGRSLRCEKRIFSFS